MKVWAAARDWDKNKPRTDFLVCSTTSPNIHTFPSLNPPEIMSNIPVCTAMLSKQTKNTSCTQWASLGAADRHTWNLPEALTKAVKDHLPLRTNIGSLHSLLS